MLTTLAVTDNFKDILGIKDSLLNLTAELLTSVTLSHFATS